MAKGQEEKGSEKHGDSEGGRSRDGLLAAIVVENSCNFPPGNDDQYKRVSHVSAALEKKVEEWREGDEGGGPW